MLAIMVTYLHWNRINAFAESVEDYIEEMSPQNTIAVY